MWKSSTLAAAALAMSLWSGRGLAEETPALLAVLQSDAGHGPKRAACQRLALIGDKRAVGVLASLLADDGLSHPARLALEQIPDPTADEALRAAVPRLKGRLLIGVINSLGVRRDALAVGLLAPILETAEGDLAGAAAIALGRIATPEAAAALGKGLDAADDARREAAGEGALRCGERFSRGPRSIWRCSARRLLRRRRRCLPWPWLWDANWPIRGLRRLCWIVWPDCRRSGVRRRWERSATRG